MQLSWIKKIIVIDKTKQSYQPAKNQATMMCIIKKNMCVLLPKKEDKINIFKKSVNHAYFYANMQVHFNSYISMFRKLTLSITCIWIVHSTLEPLYIHEHLQLQTILTIQTIPGSYSKSIQLRSVYNKLSFHIWYQNFEAHNEK